MRVHDIFSKRNEALPDIFVYDYFPQKLRNQLYHIFILTFGNASNHGRAGANDSIAEIRQVILEEYGVEWITVSGTNPMVDIGESLKKAKNNSIWLDLVEVVLRSICNFPNQEGFKIDGKSAVETANHRFRENGVGYQFDFESRQLIRVDNIVTHDQAVKPALHLLSGKKYEKANEEFLEALEDFKKADYDDCLVKCGSAFESVMKIICMEKGWSYAEKDTANTLLSTIIPNADMEGFFTQPLMLVATIRNQLSRAHGQGNITKNPPEHYAAYAINATASAILLLTEQVK